MSERTTQVNFRLPPETIEWLDEYAAFLTEESGYLVSRTQALLNLISISKREAERKIICYKSAKSMGFHNNDEFEDWLTGSGLLINKQEETFKKLGQDFGKDERKGYQDQLKTYEPLRRIAINAGRKMRLNLASAATFDPFGDDNDPNE